MGFWQGRCRRDAAEGVCTHVFHVAEGVVDRDDLSALLHARGTAHEAADAPKSRDAHLHLMRKHGRHAIKGKLGAWLVRGGPGSCRIGVAPWLRVGAYIPFCERSTGRRDGRARHREVRARDQHRQACAGKRCPRRSCGRSVRGERGWLGSSSSNDVQSCEDIRRFGRGSSCSCLCLWMRVRCVSRSCSQSKSP